jgi:hypothetical protein
MENRDLMIDELHEIRRQIYEETRNMSNKELQKYFKVQAAGKKKVVFDVEKKRERKGA